MICIALLEHNCPLSPEPDELPDGVADVGGALGVGHGLVKVGQLLLGNCHTTRALTQVVILLQTLQ